MSGRLPPLRGERTIDLEELQRRIDLVALVERDLGIQLKRSGKEWRGECPKHASDSKLTLNVNPEAGKWKCRSCEAGGDVIRFLEWSREISFKEALAIVEELAGARATRERQASAPADPLATRRPVIRETAAERPELEEHLARYEAALAGSPGEAYLAERRIPLAVAQRYRIGYAAHGDWVHVSAEGKLVRQWRPGRVTAPHTDPSGAIVNLYGRAVGDVPAQWKDWKHDHLAGRKALFNAPALVEGDGALFVCEGAFDALALAAAGLERVVACFGLDQWPWQWARTVEELVLVLDHDEHGAGQTAALSFARAARLRGKRVAIVPAATYGGAKDVAEAWQLGTLNVDMLRAAGAALARPERAYEAGDAPETPAPMQGPPHALAAFVLPPAQSAARQETALDDPFAEEEFLSPLGETEAEVLEDVYLGGDRAFEEYAEAAAEYAERKAREREARMRREFARAAWLVCDALAGGAKRSDEILELAKAAQISADSVEAAREALGVERQDLRGVGNLLRLPPGPCRCNGGDMPKRGRAAAPRT